MKLIRTLQLNLIDWTYEILMRCTTHLERRRRIVWRLWDAARQQNDRQTVS